MFEYGTPTDGSLAVVRCGFRGRRSSNTYPENPFPQGYSQVCGNHL